MKAITNLIKLNRRFSSLSTSSSSSSRSSDSTSPSWINKYLSSNQNFNSHLTLPLYRCFDSIRNNSPKHQISNTEDLSGEDVISFKLRAIALGIKSLAQHPNKITRLDQLIELQGIGKGIRNRCNMILMGKDPVSTQITTVHVVKGEREKRTEGGNEHLLNPSPYPILSHLEPPLVRLHIYFPKKNIQTPTSKIYLKPTFIKLQPIPLFNLQLAISCSSPLLSRSKSSKTSPTSQRNRTCKSKDFNQSRL